MTTHKLPVNEHGERFIPLKPLPLSVVPIEGHLTLIVDPATVLANPDGPDMVAHMLRALGMEQGMDLLIYGKCVEDALTHANVPPGYGYMFDVPLCRNQQVRR